MKDTLRTDLKSSMKSGNKLRLETVRSMMSAITNFEKSNPSTELDLPKILRGLANQRKMAISAFESAGDTERAHAESVELSIIQEYIDIFLPKQMSDSVIRMALEEIIINQGSMLNKPSSFIGRIMGEFMKTYKDHADPKQVSIVLNEILSL